MRDLDGVQTWEDFGRALTSELKASGQTLTSLWQGVVFRPGPVAKPGIISKSTYHRVLLGQSRPPRTVVQGLLRNAKRPPVEVELWLGCWERLIREQATAAHLVAAAERSSNSGSDDLVAPRSDVGFRTAADLMGMILRRRKQLMKMRANLGPNHPSVVPFEFETECYVRSLVNPQLVRARLLDRIERSIHSGHGRPRRFGTYEELLGRVDEYLTVLGVVEDELERQDVARASGADDPSAVDFAELPAPRHV